MQVGDDAHVSVVGMFRNIGIYAMIVIQIRATSCRISETAQKKSMW